MPNDTAGMVESLSAAIQSAIIDYRAGASSALDSMASFVAKRVLALLSAEGGEGWRPLCDLPDVGRKFIALYNDGSGAAMYWRHHDGFISSDGDEYPAHMSWDSYDTWAYLPDREFWCEVRSEDSFSLVLPPPIQASPSVGGGKEDQGSASQKPDPIEPRGSLPTNDGAAS